MLMAARLNLFVSLIDNISDTLISVVLAHVTLVKDLGI